MKKRRNTKNTSVQLTEEQNDIHYLFRQFLSIKSAEGIAERTLKQYKENFRFFCEYLQIKNRSYLIETMNPELFREWIMYMQFEHIRFKDIKTKDVKDVGLKPSTINTRIKTMKVMFTTLMQNQLVSSNPLTHINKVSEPEELIEVLSDKELNALLAVIDKEAYTTFRDYVLTIFLLDTMLRVSEAVTLRKSDLNVEAGFVIIRATIAKNRKARTVPVGKKVINLLLQLIKENDYGFQSEFIFAVNEYSYYNRHNYNQRLKEYAKLANIEKRVHPHLFRHTSATKWLENGGGLEELRLILGHSKYDMVKRYAHIADNSIISASKKYSLTNFINI
ncbi:tyrosine-type recombinase/integrase [Psychrobacillus sp. FSL K6-2684]|uniref:tyrosine-type recombinase/integrase n=1 Tax=Psychrobacillus sp. FSL K6-2684 TaxID=2921547 RepID=UPI0030FC5350